MRHSTRFPYCRPFYTYDRSLSLRAEKGAPVVFMQALSARERKPFPCQSCINLPVVEIVRRSTLPPRATIARKSKASQPADRPPRNKP